MRKTVGIIIGVVVLVGIGIWWWQSSDSNPVQQEISDELTPEIEFASLSITDINDDRVNVDAELILKNTYPVDFTSSSMEYEIYIDSIKVVEDEYNDPVSIEPGDSTVIELPLEIYADRLNQIMTHFKQEDVDSAQFTMDASVVLDVPIEGEEEIDLSMSKTMPAIKSFGMEIVEMDTNILSSNDGLDLVVRVTNPNSYPSQITDASFSFTIEEEMEVVGQLQDSIYVPAGGTEDVAVHAEKEWGSITQSALDFFFNQQDTGFTIRYSGTLHSDNKMLDKTNFNLRVDGTLNELSEAAGL